ncbi:MAG: hypothetical protein EA339_06810 [Rhodobacteraceae bacterium]|nr:MAG: hypothetical protein EA339_06810 [Paracoccaceae bacterium]
MREVTHGDIRAAARVLLSHAEQEWPHLVARMLVQAHHADCYRKAMGRLHPGLGNGTLMSVALAKAPVAEPPASDRRYLTAIRAVLEAVLAWKAR